MANVIAWPAGYYFLNKVLSNYAYRFNIGLEIFILSRLVTFFIAFLTVRYKSICSSMANPVDSIGYE